MSPICLKRSPAAERLFPTATLAYFLAVLAALGVLMRVMPGQGFSR